MSRRVSPSPSYSTPSPRPTPTPSPTPGLNPFLFVESNANRFFTTFHPSKGFECSSQFKGQIMKLVGTVDNVIFQDVNDPMLKASVHCIQPLLDQGQTIQLMSFRNKPGLAQEFVTLYNANQEHLFSIFATSLHDRLSDSKDYLLELIGFGLATEQRGIDGNVFYVENQLVYIRDDLQSEFVMEQQRRSQINQQQIQEQQRQVESERQISHDEDVRLTQIAEQERVLKVQDRQRLVTSQEHQSLENTQNGQMNQFPQNYIYSQIPYQPTLLQL
ncbi:MAG: hypothetical protein EZS28_028401 [Streblomastix strix]|uniref:Uncharacterized protein n=1 Tax=Streblomastix strix TaxID=222440 RepID=A0A5J4V0M5_9EUKA|nr:MAG: hypothetical protein EZS28_028401 [Streblomastix strix]